MTRSIHQLPPNLINRIAAGEVIERPASVVKELVENSLDAGAKQITIEIEDGGLSLIRIIDDGSGIPAGELPLAFASHATSKLLNDDDLFNIATMGFRGEALASIGSVAHARILSRTADTASAAEISNRGGELSGVQAAAGNGGTVIEVRNLFFNTPARRKFLKGPSTEYGHIADAVLRLALPYPGVAFRLLHNNRCTLNLPATTAHDRLLAAWPGDFHAQAMSLEADDAEVQLTGLIGLPELARPTAKHQYIYLNGRSIRDRFIQHALREAYRGLTEPGRHPAAILMIGIPPQDVDVNVHPTKSEVRFKNSGRIHSLVLSGVRQQLLGNDLTPRAMPQVQASTAQPRPDLRAQLAAFLKGESPGDAPAPFAQGPADSSIIAPSSSSMNVPMAAPHYAAPRMAQTTPAAPVTTMPAETDKAIQLHNSYLVAQSDDGLVIIDQHALHERIMYEELLARLSRGTLESQAMLIPQPFGVSARQMDLLKQIEPLLQRLGIEIVPFGPDTAAVQAFPTFLEKLDPIRFITELLERGEQELLDLHDEELLHEVLDMMACKAAIKAGDPLTPAEVQALLAQRDLVERSSNCPHGRPTTLRLSLKDLEKQFKRTGF